MPCFLDLVACRISFSNSTSAVPVAEARTIVEVADTLAQTDDAAWAEPFLLFGHSRGGGISTIAAAGFPDRIRALVVCESGLGLSYETGVTRLESFRAGYETERSYAARSGRVFESLEAAVAQNKKEMMKNDRTARNIVSRHIRETDGRWGESRWVDGKWVEGAWEEGGWQIQHEERQKARGFGGWRCGIVFSEEVNARHLEAIDCPVLLVQAKRDGAAGGAQRSNEANLARIKDVVRKEVKGLHHVHSDRPAAVAGGLVLPWLAEKLGAPLGVGGAASKL